MLPESDYLNVMSDYHHTVEKIKTLLDQHGAAYKCFEHEAVRTSEEAAAIRPEYTLAQGEKVLQHFRKRLPAILSL